MCRTITSTLDYLVRNDIYLRLRRTTSGCFAVIASDDGKGIASKTFNDYATAKRYFGEVAREYDMVTLD